MPGLKHLSSTLPSALEQVEDLSARLRGKRLALFLDYDGTLTPIVARPDLAMLGAEMRQSLANLARSYPTAVISGRACADVRHAVDLEGFYYAGNHGLEIEGPGIESLTHEAAQACLPALREVYRTLAERLADIEGILIEDKTLSLSVHYRNVAAGQVERIAQAVDAALAEHAALMRRDGKKVFEIRPDIDWDKGRAVLWLLQATGLDGEDVVPIYIGDDITDEDAFHALHARGNGLPIIVLDDPRETEAEYVLRGIDEVNWFLERLVELRGEHPG